MSEKERRRGGVKKKKKMKKKKIFKNGRKHRRSKTPPPSLRSKQKEERQQDDDDDENVIDLTTFDDESTKRRRRRLRRPTKKQQIKYSPMPRYRISLDKDPCERWNQVATDAKFLLPEAVERLEQHIIGKNIFRRLLYQVVCIVLTFICYIGYVSSRVWCCKNSLTSEIWGFARIAGLSPGKILVMQYVYEAATYCTSVVLQTEIPIHLRTMDWDMGFDMRPFTIQVDFLRKGKVLFRAVTWTGYFGILTAQKPNRFSVSVNYRPSSGYNDTEAEVRLTLTTVLRILIGVFFLQEQIVGSLVRKVMETKQSVMFDDAVKMLSNGSLLSPVYFIVAGNKKGEGIGITRKAGRAFLRHQLLNSSNKNGAVVQCNTDWWKSDPLIDMMESKYRKKKASGLIDRACKSFEILPLMEASQLKDCDDHDPAKHANESGALETYWNFVGTNPIRNDITVYACVMCPAASIFSARCNAEMPILQKNKRVKKTKYVRPSCLRGDALKPLSY